jgi:hypothetical protein
MGDAQIIPKEINPKCTTNCKQHYHNRVEICNELFNNEGSPYYGDATFHKKCLRKAKTELDNCISMCK